MSPHRNSFNFARFVAALAVLIGHHFALSGHREGALPISRDTLGGTAVAVFFVINRPRSMPGFAC